MLRIQYHTKFKSRSTLLVAGAADDMGRLLEVFREWYGDDLDLLTRLREVDQVTCDGVVSITLSRAKTEKDSYVTLAEKKAVWSVSRRGQPRIIGMLEALKNSACPAHQYLDFGDPKGIQIVCSKDEYFVKPTRPD